MLVRIDSQAAYSNLEVTACIKKCNYDERNAALLNTFINGVQKNLSYIDELIAASLKKADSFKGLPDQIKALLRLSTFQIVYMHSSQTPLIVNEAVIITKQMGLNPFSGLVNAVLRSVSKAFEDAEEAPAPADAQAIATKHSHPLWMVERWVVNYGLQAAETICKFNNMPHRMCLRVNGMVADSKIAMDCLKQSGITVSADGVLPAAIWIDGKAGAVHKTDCFRNGMVSMQDAGSMLPVLLLSPMEGETILDCCSAPGTKTSQIAELINNNGRVVAGDISPRRLELIKDNLDRLKIHCVETIVMDAREMEQLNLNFDRILIDAPCSGTGVLSKRADSRWKKSYDDITELCAVQKQILNSAASVLKEGGVLVYSTCSIEPEENEQQVDAFLIDNPSFDKSPPDVSIRYEETFGCVDGYFRVLPHIHNMEGYFMARLIKKSGEINE